MIGQITAKQLLLKFLHAGQNIPMKFRNLHTYEHIKQL